MGSTSDGLDSLRRQHSIFAGLNLLLLLLLWSFHNIFISFWGAPSATLLALLGGSAAVRAAELLWLRRRELRPSTSRLLTVCSIAFNLILALVLASIVDREDSQYSALLVVPILECAFRFGMKLTVTVAGVADFIVFYWVWRYFAIHPPLRVGEYFEAGTLSIILVIVAVLVSSMVQTLRRKQEQLEITRERLVHQEKLAAVGRFSSALAHEIRNPVAMISSSLTTAKTLDGPDREQMLEIAAKESSRLVNLTNDLLSYARPRKPVSARGTLRDIVMYVADACRAQAAAKDVSFDIHASDDIQAEYDEALLQRALMNLVINAVDASPQGATVSLSVDAAGGTQARIDVENRGGPVAAGIVERLYEPFFTTKPSGTGLGLATAYSDVRAQGGELALADNSQTVRFSVFLPRAQLA